MKMKNISFFLIKFSRQDQYFEFWEADQKQKIISYGRERILDSNSHENIQDREFS